MGSLAAQGSIVKNNRIFGSRSTLAKPQAAIRRLRLSGPTETGGPNTIIHDTRLHSNVRISRLHSGSFERSMYSPVRVSTRNQSPMLMNAGARIWASVSNLTGLETLVAVLPLTAGSQYSTCKIT